MKPGNKEAQLRLFGDEPIFGKYFSIVGGAGVCHERNKMSKISKIIEYPKKGSNKNPIKIPEDIPGFKKRPDRFVSPIFSERIEGDIIQLSFLIKLSKREELRIAGILDLINEYFDKK